MSVNSYRNGRHPSFWTLSYITRINIWTYYHLLPVTLWKSLNKCYISVNCYWLCFTLYWHYLSYKTVNYSNKHNLQKHLLWRYCCKVWIPWFQLHLTSKYNVTKSSNNMYLSVKSFTLSGSICICISTLIDSVLQIGDLYLTSNQYRMKILLSVNWNISECPLIAHEMFTEIRISGMVQLPFSGHSTPLNAAEWQAHLINHSSFFLIFRE